MRYDINHVMGILTGICLEYLLYTWVDTLTLYQPLAVVRVWRTDG